MIIRLKDLVKDFAIPAQGGEPATHFRALDGITATFQPGDRVGIIGPNGAGKTTLLQVISGVSSASAGECEVDGQVSAILSLGVVLQEELSGRENVRIEASLKGTPALQLASLEREVEEFADLGEFFDRPVRTYSTGMKSRLAFGVATAVEPEILIVDEALSVGDRQFGQRAAAKITQLCDQGGIVLIVSHSLAALRRLCNRCVWISGGKVVADGLPQDVLDAYRSASLADREERLLATYEARRGGQSLRAGVAIEDAAFLDDAGTPRHLVETGAPARLRVLVQGGAGGRLQVELHRSDGLLLLRSRVSLPDTPRAELTLPFEALPFGQATYEVVLQVLGEDDEVLARYHFPLRVEDPEIERGATAWRLDVEWSTEDEERKRS